LQKEASSLKKKRYTEEQIREILATAYPGKTEEEIDAMVQETMSQYLEDTQIRANGQRKKT
jgi:hypothetical protein